MTEHNTIDYTELFIYLTVDVILKRDNLNDSCCPALPCDTVY